MIEVEESFIVVEAEPLTEEEQARNQRAQEVPEHVINNFIRIIDTYFNHFDEDEKYMMSLAMLGIALEWFKEKGFTGELRNICINCMSQFHDIDALLVKEKLPKVLH